MAAAKEVGELPSLNPSAAVTRVLAECTHVKEERAAEEAAKPEKKPALEETLVAKKRKLHGVYTDGRAALSFTSSTVPLYSQVEMREMTEVEVREEVYAGLRKKKVKGYVRLVTTVGALNLELHCDWIPFASDSFLRHCESGYYNGSVFFRCIKNFMIQGGDPTNTGKGGQSAFKDGKPFRDECDSRLLFQGIGILAMANSGKCTNRSQFFITFKSCEHLNNKHTIFGKCVGGLDVLREMQRAETDKSEKPLTDIRVLRTEVFKNPFPEAFAAAERDEPAVVEPATSDATWRIEDPMLAHAMRQSDAVGKYCEKPAKAAKGPVATAADLEYAVTTAGKARRTGFDMSKFAL